MDNVQGDSIEKQTIPDEKNKSRGENEIEFANDSIIRNWLATFDEYHKFKFFEKLHSMYVCSLVSSVYL